MPTCLYCLKTKPWKEFKSEEHPIPKGLGNDEIVIPKGVVCDDCNNTVLSQLDVFLLDFPPIKFNRTFYGVKSRKKKPIEFKSQQFAMTHVTDDHLNIEVRDNGSVSDEHDKGFTISSKSGTKFTDDDAKKLARALYKISLGLIYKDLGRDVAYSERFDEVRKIILGEKNFHGQLFIVRKNRVEHLATVQHVNDDSTDDTRSVFRFYYYGIEIIYEIEKRAYELPDDFPKDAISKLEF